MADLSGNQLSSFQSAGEYICSATNVLLSNNRLSGGVVSNGTLSRLTLNNNQLAGDVAQFLRCVQVFARNTIAL